MRLLNKLLLASTMVVALGAATSCGNKEQTGFTGLPYTYIELCEIKSDEECTIGFQYEGDEDVEIYWDSDEPSKETTHTFEGELYSPYIFIKGKVTSLWFSDKDGKLIADGNNKIRTIIFSNTITNIPENAFRGMYELSTVFIPASVKTIGANAFGVVSFYTFYCEYEKRPSGWDPNWCMSPTTSEFVIWDISFHVTDDNMAYIIYSRNEMNIASCLGYVWPNDDVKEFKLDKTISIKNRKFDIVALISVGEVNLSITSASIPDSICYISDRAFWDCSHLTSVKFEGNFDILGFDDKVFYNCYSLSEVTLPEGLVNLSHDTFRNCSSLIRVTIPSTVKVLEDEVFRGCSSEKDLTIDVTAYKTADSIAVCINSPFDLSEANKITFIYDNTVVNPTDFTCMNWPKASEASSNNPKIVWQPMSSLI